MFDFHPPSGMKDTAVSQAGKVYNTQKLKKAIAKCDKVWEPVLV